MAFCGETIKTIGIYKSKDRDTQAKANISTEQLANFLFVGLQAPSYDKNIMARLWPSIFVFRYLPSLNVHISLPARVYTCV